jgi:hypothetical protein
MDEYEVEITSVGRSGNVIYKEHGGALRFWWEFSTTGAFVNIPSDKNWDNYCERENSAWGKGRKAVIIERVAAEIRRQKATTSRVEIQDEWINLYF